MQRNQIAPLSFEGTRFQLIDVNGTMWVRGVEIGQALGYARPAVSIHNLYTRNTSEFTEAMTMVVPVADLDTRSEYADPTLHHQIGDAGHELGAEAANQGQTREVRLFSPRGAHLLAIFARTKRAAEFRHWVLDVLEGVAAAESKQPLTFSQEMQCIRTSVWLMEKVEQAKGLERAEELYLRLMKVNRRLGMPTMAFAVLARNWRQGELPLNGGRDADPEVTGH